MKPAKPKGEQDIDGAVARELRTKLGISQREFWEPVGLPQGAGCKFETGLTKNMTKSVRMLVYARYVAGLHLDASTPEGVKNMLRLAKLQRSEGKI